MTRKPLTEITGQEERLSQEPEKVDESHLVLMYGNTEEDEEDDDGVFVPSPLKKPFDDSGVSVITTHPRFNMVKIGKTTYNFPNVQYMEALEKRVITQEREILKLSNKNKLLADKSNQLVGEINDIWKELDKKINRRDML